MKNKEKIKKKDEKEEIEVKVTDIFPIADEDTTLECFILKDGSYMDLFLIETKDLSNLDEEDIEFDIMCFEKLYKTYAGDLKVVSFNFPVDVAEQTEYIKGRMEKTKNPVFLKLLKRKEEEFNILSSEYTDRQFALMFYGKDKEEHKENALTILSCLQRGKTPLVHKISFKKKKDILFKLFNKNTIL